MFSIGAVILVGIIISLLLVLYYKNNKKSENVWAEQNVKYISQSMPIFKLDIMKDEIENYKKFGRVYGRFDGILPVLTVGDRELVEKIMSDFTNFPNRRDIRVGDPTFDRTLFSLEGDDWRRVRNIVKIGFTNSNLKKMMTLLQECCDRMIDRLSEKMEKEEIVNCQKNFSDFVLNSIARCAFGIRITDNDPFKENANKFFTDSWKTYLAVFAPSLMRFFKVSVLNADTTKFYNILMSNVLEERSKMEKKKFNDFLQRMIDFSDMDEDSNNNNDTNNKQTPGKLSHEELLAQCVTFFLAGYETTTSLLSHCIFQLAKNQDCQDRVVEEIGRFINEEYVEESDEAERNDSMYNDLNKLKYMDSVIKECFRLAPAMARIERRAENYVYFSKEGIQLKKGYLVSIPVLAIHYDSEYYIDPYVFNPDRFYQCERKEFKNIFFPFGSGLRECVGKNFVDMQTKLCLVNLLRNFHFTLAPSSPEFLKTIENRNVLKVDNVDVILRKRILV